MFIFSSIFWKIFAWIQGTTTTWIWNNFFLKCYSHKLCGDYDDGLGRGGQILTNSIKLNYSKGLKLTLIEGVVYGTFQSTTIFMIYPTTPLSVLRNWNWLQNYNHLYNLFIDIWFIYQNFSVNTESHSNQNCCQPIA